MKNLILSLVIVSSPWFWRILNSNPLVVVLLVVITLSLLAFLNLDKNKLTLGMTIGLTFIATLFLVRSNFDKSLLTQTFEETSIINQRRSYYPKILGRIFQNKASLSFHSYTRNFFDGLDPNIYFFAGHPRERSGISEFERFSPLLIPFLLIGILTIIKVSNIPFLLFFVITSITGGFLDRSFSLGSIFFFPLICVLVTEGLSTALVKAGYYKSLAFRKR